MNVFDLDAELIGRYQDFARSFTTIRAEDIEHHEVCEDYRRRAALQRQTRAGRPPTYATIKATEEMTLSDNQANN